MNRKLHNQDKMDYTYEQEPVIEMDLEAGSENSQDSFDGFFDPFLPLED